MPLSPLRPGPSAADLASRLPAPLRRPAGAMGGLIESITGASADPRAGMQAAMPMTTIGPDAIPLSNYGEYLEKALGSVMGDMRGALRHNPRLSLDTSTYAPQTFRWLSDLPSGSSGPIADVADRSIRQDLSHMDSQAHQNILYDLANLFTSRYFTP